MEHPQIRGLSDWCPLARGPLTEVWEARQLSLDRRVAVKIYGPERDEADRGFMREIAAVGRLSSHPGIITVYDAGMLPDDRLYLIMEHCPAGSLSQWLDPQNRLSDERVRRVGIQIADALAAAHSAGVLHRGVMPAHILIDSYGNARLADFGLAVIVGAASDDVDVPPVPSDYAPPEAFARQPATERGDVFSLAATLYALLTGQAPHRGDRTPGAEDAVAETWSPPLSAVDGTLVDAVMSGLHIDPAARPIAAQFRDQLTNVSLVRTSAGRPTVAAASGMPMASTADSVSSPSRSGRMAVAAGTPAPEGTAGQVAPADARPGWVRRRAGVPTLAAAAVAVIASAVMWLISESATDSAAPEIRTPTVGSSEVAGPAPSSQTTPPPGGNRTGAGSTPTNGAIQLENSALSTKPFQVVQVRGTYPGGADRFLRAQRWEDGKWISFPLPAKTDQSGRFTIYVELARSGRYQLRAVDPASGLTSNPTVVLVKD
jgi:hypothetical protein